MRKLARPMVTTSPENRLQQLRPSERSSIRGVSGPAIPSIPSLPAASACRRLLTIAFLWLISANLDAQPRPDPEEGLTVDELLAAAGDWAGENLDDEVLELFADVDRDRVRTFLVDLMGRFQTNSVYELAPLRQSAQDFVPFFEQWEETLPFAEWLRTRLDYLEVSEELKRSASAPGKATSRPAPKATTTVMTPPTVQVQRAVWERKFERRAVPARAQAYLARLKQIFADEKTPAELVWIAEVESSFNPSARSPAGAAGLFQLMKPTAKSYGLSTFLPDERTHPEKNARAAAKYLRYLHNRFGDWPLALAAYNAGETRVDKLLKTARTRDYPSIAHRLPAETQFYVPKCEAAVRKREGVSLAELKIPAG